MRCFVCGAQGGTPFFEARGIPVHANRLGATREEALAAPRGDLVLVACARCLLVRNDAFDPSRLAYDERYETSLHFSGTFQAYAEGLARRLVEEVGVRGADVLEIGCGAGEFLRLLCALGGNRGVGVDPVHAGLEEAVPGGGRLRIVGEPFGAGWAPASADVVVARHVLEHVAEPVALLSAVRRALRPGGLAYVEVPNGLWTLREGGIFDLVYEHCSYFVAGSLAAALRSAGLEPEAVEEAYGGQFLGALARPVERATPAPPSPSPEGLEIADLCARFGDLYRTEIEAWRGRFAALQAAGKRAALWGAGSKGVTFANVFPGEAGVLRVAVDQNPRKQGRFVPGTGHPIVAPEALAADPPAAVVLLNPLYRGEVSTALAAIGVRAEILLPATR